MYILICAAVFLAAYLLNTTLIGLARGQREYTDEVRDLEFEISALNRKGLWFLPYLIPSRAVVSSGFAHE